MTTAGERKRFCPSQNPPEKLGSSGCEAESSLLRFCGSLTVSRSARRETADSRCLLGIYLTPIGTRIRKQPLSSSIHNLI